MVAIACLESYLPRLAIALEQAMKAQAVPGQTAPGMPVVINYNGHAVAHTVISGPMIADDSFWQTGLRGKLDEMVRLDSEVAGHLITFDSGGGFVNAGQLAYDAISRLKKPKIGHASMAASAAMMAAAATDEIMISADGMSVLGSVGVMLSLPAWYVKYYKELQLDIYPDSSKDKNGAARAMLEDGDYGPIKEELRRADMAFKALVRKSRSARAGADVPDSSLTGKTYIGRDAIRAGLADSQGTTADALSRLSTLIRKSK